MASKHLAVTPSVPAIHLSESGVIQVGSGEHRYYIYQDSACKADQQYVFELAHPGSRIFITGLVLASQAEQPRLHIEIRHLAPHTEAESLVKTVASDMAQPHFEGLIYIPQGSTGCASFLNHHSLLLSPGAHSWSRPSLEILHDEVRCSHAATVHHIKERDLLYARAHGLSLDDARSMHIDAFMAEVREDRIQKRPA